MRLVTITQAGTLKGNEIILRTAKILKEQFDFDFEWNVAGNLKSFHIAENKTGIKHEKYNISLLGLIDASDVANQLRISDAYIHPAIIDNSPNSLCEAQVVGCPVIAANVGGISSLVDDGHTGILYPYNEPHMLAFKIMDLRHNRDLQTQLSINEIRTAEERHNPYIIYKCLNEIYTDILHCIC
jgi:glycosyltransferase involved in cell wall biosynthesis